MGAGGREGGQAGGAFCSRRRLCELRAGGGPVVQVGDEPERERVCGAGVVAPRAGHGRVPALAARALRSAEARRREGAEGDAAFFTSEIFSSTGTTACHDSADYQTPYDSESLERELSKKYGVNGSASKWQRVMAIRRCRR